MLLRATRSIACLVTLALLLAAATTSRDPRVIYEKKSQYNLVSVREDRDGVRTLVFEDGATQSAMKVAKPEELVLSYARAIMAGLAVVPRPNRILIVGLGGGSMPMFLRRAYPDLWIDIAELDPVVADVARQFFCFVEDPRMKVHIGDGRKFIETTSNRYDIIFLDAYGADSIPYSLATREFLRAVRAKLTAPGIVVSNVWGPPSNSLYHSMVRTYRDVFDELHVICAPLSENRILIALPRERDLTRAQLVRSAAQVRARYTPQIDLPSIISSGYQPAEDLPPDARVLLDADAPPQ